MEKKKLLIADGEEAFSGALEAALKEEFHIRIADSGEKTLEILEQFVPDVLVLDVMLPGLDGIAVLAQAAQRGWCPKVLATTSLRSEYIFTKLMQFEISYVMLRPCNLEIAAERVREIAAVSCEIPMVEPSEEQKLTAILRELGVNPKHNGYHYLCGCIKLYGDDNTQQLTKELYVTVGATYGVSWQQVERSIRSALEAAWNHRNAQIWRQWFSAGSELKRPTNGEVICQLAEHLRLEQGRKIG